MKTLSDGIELRILSEKCPHYNAKEETMTLEDIFTYLLSPMIKDKTTEITIKINISATLLPFFEKTFFIS